jgi:hypothetical protein
MERKTAGKPICFKYESGAASFTNIEFPLGDRLLIIIFCLKFDAA